MSKKSLSGRISLLELEVFGKDRTDYPEYLSVSEYARVRGVTLNHSQILTMAKAAVDRCQELDKPIDYVLNYGSPVNVYPVEVLNEIIEECL